MTDCDALYQYMAIEVPDDDENGPNCYGNVLNFLSTCNANGSREAKTENFNQYCLNPHKGRNFASLCKDDLFRDSHENIFNRMVKQPVVNCNIPRIPQSPLPLYSGAASANVQVFVGTTKFVIFSPEDSAVADNIVLGDVLTGKTETLTKIGALFVLLNKQDELYVIDIAGLSQYSSNTGTFGNIATVNFPGTPLSLATISGSQIGCISGVNQYQLSIAPGATWTSLVHSHECQFLQVDSDGEYVAVADLGGNIIRIFVSLFPEVKQLTISPNGGPANLSNFIKVSATLWYFIISVENSDAVQCRLEVVGGGLNYSGDRLAPATHNSIGAELFTTEDSWLNTGVAIYSTTIDKPNATLRRPIGTLVSNNGIASVWSALDKTVVVSSKLTAGEILLQVTDVDGWDYFLARANALLQDPSTPSTASLKFIGNGDVVVATGTEILLSSNTTDEFTPSLTYMERGYFIELTEPALWVSRNGTYIFNYSEDKGQSYLQFNPYNGSNFLDYCQNFDATGTCDDTIPSYCGAYDESDQRLVLNLKKAIKTFLKSCKFMSNKAKTNIQHQQGAKTQRCRSSSHCSPEQCKVK